MVSPNFKTLTPFCLNVVLISIGSRAGSSSIPTFSIKTGFPKRMADSNVLSKSRSDNLQIEIPLSRPCKSTFYVLLIETFWNITIFLTHLLACPCGSINKGHLLEQETKTAFSVDK